VYESAISRRDRGCIIFLLDRSDSMKLPWSPTETLAAGAATAINDILMELCLRSQVEPGRVRYYFDIGVFGYGLRPSDGGEGVESAFNGALAGQALVSLPDVRDKPVMMRQVPSVDAGAPPSSAPLWIRPMYGQRTPMCEAMSVAGGHIYEWASVHPDSFPPVIINITDGMVTDNPYQGTSLDGWADRLKAIQTNDGHALLFNIFLSSDSSDRVLFPATPQGLPDPGPDLFRISSLLPPPMIANARAEGMAAPAGARGFGFNADSAMLVRFLKIGTHLEVRD
jgi:hypothetical protein